MQFSDSTIPNKLSQMSNQTFLTIKMPTSQWLWKERARERERRVERVERKNKKRRGREREKERGKRGKREERKERREREEREGTFIEWTG